MTTNGKTNGKSPVERTFKDVSAALKSLKDFVGEHAEAMEQFTTLADAFNQARDAHLKALKAAKAESPLYVMSIPHTFECSDVDTAKKILKDRFDEYFKTTVKPKTDAVRNALKSDPEHVLGTLVEEIEETPRHEGPKAIDLSALV